MIELESAPSLTGLLLTFALFFLGFIVSSYYAHIKGFLSLPFKSYVGVYCKLKDLLFIFCFFIFLSFIFSSILYKLFLIFFIPSKEILTVVPVCLFFINFTFLTIFAILNKKFYLFNLVKDFRFPGKQSIASDIFSGIKTLALSLFPLFALTSLIEATFLLFNVISTAEQAAVKYLMDMKDHPLTLFLALFTIIIAAPITEEFLFRGVIQSFFRKKIGSLKAIALTSIIFSLFHFSLSQGYQNIAILLNLFLLSLYLGFIYEKTRSLVSCISLHFIFNFLNALKIIFYGLN